MPELLTAPQSRLVCDLPVDEQPRERLMRYGARSLSDAELGSILIRTGSRGLNVLDTCRSLLMRFGGLHRLVRKSWKEMRVVKGIADVKAITLEAVFELSRRLQTATPEERVFFKTPESVAAYFGPRLRDLQTEQFVVAFLNAAKALTGYEIVSQGGKTATIVDPSEVMRQAIMNEANSIIILHNHPSGNRRASRADMAITKKLVEAGKLLDIAVDDHIIVAGYDYLSLRAEGLISFEP